MTAMASFAWPRVLAILWLCVGLPSGRALSVTDLYPFGPAVSNSALPQDIDVSSPEVELSTEIKFFDESYKSIFVSFQPPCILHSQL